MIQGLKYLVLLYWSVEPLRTIDQVTVSCRLGPTSNLC